MARVLEHAAHRCWEVEDGVVYREAGFGRLSTFILGRWRVALREVAEVNMDVVVAEKGQLLEMGR